MLKQSSITPALANHLAKVKAAIEAVSLPEFPTLTYIPYAPNGPTWFDDLDRMSSDKRND